MELNFSKASFWSLCLYRRCAYRLALVDGALVQRKQGQLLFALDRANLDMQRKKEVYTARRTVNGCDNTLGVKAQRRSKKERSGVDLRKRTLLLQNKNRKE